MRFGMKHVVGIAAAALMTLSSLSPALADDNDSDQVTVNATVAGYLAITVSGSPVSINNAAFNTCNVGSGAVTLNVVSNDDYSGTVTGSSGGPLLITQLWRNPSQTVDSDCSATGVTTDAAFSGSSQAWFGTQTATAQAGVDYYERYALALGSYALVGPTTFTLTYAASQ